MNALFLKHHRSGLGALLLALGAIAATAAAPRTSVRAAHRPGKPASSIRRAPQSRVPHPVTGGNQGPDYTWVQTLDVSGSFEQAWSTVFDTQGNVVAAGYVAQQPDATSFIVRKYDPTGKLIWSWMQPDAPSGYLDQAYSVVVDRLGNVIAGGKINGMFTVVNLTSNGVLRWRKDLGPFSSSLTSCNSVAIDSVNNVVAAGSIENNGTSADFAVVKFLGSDGFVAWDQEIDGGAADYDVANAVVVDTNDNVIAAGELASNFRGPARKTRALGDGDPNFAVVKFDKDGKQQWDSIVNGSAAGSFDSAFSVAVNSAGMVAATGVTQNNSDDFTTVLLNPSGTPVWRHDIDGTFSQSHDEGESVAFAANGDVVVGGVVEQPIFGNNNVILDHFAVAKFRAADGSFVLYELVHGTGGPSGGDDNIAHSVAVGPDDSIVATGWLLDADTGRDYFTASYATNGNLNWSRILDGSASGDDEAFSVAIDKFGNVATAGFTTGVNTDGDFTVAYIDQQAPVLFNCMANPSQLPAAGGTTTVTVEAKDNVAVDHVLVHLFGPGATNEPDVPLTFNGTNWSGQVTVPANPTKFTNHYDLIFTGFDTTNNPGMLNCPDAIQTSADTQPPDIVDCLLSPNPFPSSGGTAVVDAQVVDNVSVASVTAKITGPDNRVQTVPMTFNAGFGRYEAFFDVAGNKTSQPMNYHVEVTATDAAGNSTTKDCGNETVSPDTTPPEIRACSLDPMSLPDTGGQVHVSATVVDQFGEETVQAEVTRPDLTKFTVPLTFNSTSENFEGTFSLPSNPTAAPVAYSVKVTATDQAANSSTQPCGNVQVGADDVPPAVDDCEADPNTLPAAGGTVALSVQARDDVALDNSSVVAEIVTPDNTTIDIPLTKDANDDFFRGTFTVGVNDTGSDLTFGLSFFAADVAGNSVQLDCDSIVQNPDTTQPLLDNCSFNPSTVPPAGGTVTFSVDATDDVGVDSVVVQLINQTTNAVSTVNLSRVGSSNTYTGTLSLGQNFSGANVVFATRFVAKDKAGNTGSMPCGNLTWAGDNSAPNILSCSVSPTVLPQSGGDVTITARVTDDVAVATVSAIVAKPDNSTETVAMSLKPGTSDQYTAVYHAAAAPAGSSQGYSVEIVAKDSSGNATAADCGTFTVGGASAGPSITNCSVTPHKLGQSGGDVTISADVNDGAALKSVVASITRPDGSNDTVALTGPKAGASGTYSGTYSVPAAPAGTPQVYKVTIFASDVQDLSASVPCDSITVGSDTLPPVLTQCTVTPRTLQPSGGSVEIRVNAADNVSIASVQAIVTGPNGSVTVPLATKVKGGNGLYIGTVTLEANNTKATQQYSVSIVAADSFGNTKSTDCGHVGVLANGVPIQIGACSVSPATVGSRGGKVKITADIYADTVSEATATITQPLGRPPVTVKLTRTGDIPGGGATKGKGKGKGRAGGSGAGQYSGTFTVPSNLISQSLTYSVVVDAKDAKGNTAHADCSTFTQELLRTPGGEISLSDGGIDFGNIKVGWGDWQTVTVTNTGDDTLSGTIGSVDAPFSIVSIDGGGNSSTASNPRSKAGKGGKGGKEDPPPGSTAFTLEPGQSLKIKVQYAPTDLSASSSQIEINSTDQKRPTVKIGLKGIGCGGSSGTGTASSTKGGKGGKKGK